jgi:uncharacterized protein (TIGR02996 family)
VSHAADLLAAIIADPTDLARRQVYADLLEAEGDPRGTFISQQCRLSTMDPIDSEYPGFVADTHRLLTQHAETWLTPLFDALGIPAADRSKQAGAGGSLALEFERGFVSTLALDIDRAGPRAAALQQVEPLDGITLQVSEYIPEDRRVFPEIATWRRLGVEASDWFTDNSLAHVLHWPLDRVERLSLARCAIGIGGCQLLANLATDLGETFDDYVPPPPLPLAQLRSLDLRGCAIGDTGLEILAAAPTLSALESLDLTQNRLDVASLDRLRSSPVLTHLRELSLAGNAGLGPALGQLAGWAPIARLRRFKIPQTTTPAALAALFPQPSANLRELILTSNKLIGPDPDLIARCAQHYTALDLGTAKLGDDGLRKLVAAPSVASVTRLALNGCSISDKGVAELTASTLDRLTHLDLSSNKLVDRSLERLADWPGLQHVTYLRLGNNRKLSEVGFEALTKSPYFEPAQLLVGNGAKPAVLSLLDARFGNRVARA